MSQDFDERAANAVFKGAGGIIGGILGLTIGIGRLIPVRHWKPIALGWLAVLVGYSISVTTFWFLPTSDETARTGVQINPFPPFLSCCCTLLLFLFVVQITSYYISHLRLSGSLASFGVSVKKPAHVFDPKIDVDDRGLEIGEAIVWNE